LAAATTAATTDFAVDFAVGLAAGFFSAGVFDFDDFATGFIAHSKYLKLNR
jgi:hypothetical protein